LCCNIQFAEKENVDTICPREKELVIMPQSPHFLHWTEPISFATAMMEMQPIRNNVSVLSKMAESIVTQQIKVFFTFHDLS